MKRIKTILSAAVIAGSIATVSAESKAPAPAVVPPDHEQAKEIDGIPKEKREAEYAKGTIDYDLLRSTKVKDKPPPIYGKTLKALDEKQVSIRGFMAPYDDQDSMYQFMLFPFPVGCYFCAPPGITEVLFIRQKKEKGAVFVEGPIEITGTFKLWTPESEDEAHQQRFLYLIDEATVTSVEVPKEK
jgi:hypothetical protein